MKNNSCYVILHNVPNIDDPKNMVTTVLGVAATLKLAEKMIVRDADYQNLICDIQPDFTSSRDYYRADECANMLQDGALVEHYTVDEYEIEGDWASV
jgi:hypothetical protein